VKPRILFVLLALSVLSLTTAVGSTAAAAEPKPIHVGWTGGSNWTSLPDRVAMERGFFEKDAKPQEVVDWTFAERARR
jgi:ABC-type nitrate/sulfonate/bicarbonate transport system substrate-binding protein